MAHQSSHCGHGNKVQQPNIIGHIFRDYSEAYIQQYKPNREKIKLIKNIRKCRTPAMGAIVLKCEGCGEKTYIYLSCGDSRCPICQYIKRMQVQHRISLRMLEVPYVHTTFTVPHCLNRLIKQNKKVAYSILYRTAWKTIKKLCGEPDNLGALPGMIAIMHTWGSDMKYHVHLHTLITFGGLNESDQWVYPKRKNKIAPYRKVNATFRHYFIAELEKAIKKAEVKVDDRMLADIEEAKKRNWVVNNGKPKIDTDTMEEYISRYVMKIAVSNSRLTYDEAKKKVYLVHNDYANQKEGEAAPKKVKVFDPLSFIHQFLEHLPPKRFVRLRYYGLHHGITFKRIKGKITKLLKGQSLTVMIIMRILLATLKLKAKVCTHCGGMDFIESSESPDSQWLKNNVRNYDTRAGPKTVKYDPLNNLYTGTGVIVMPKKTETDSQSILLSP